MIKIVTNFLVIINHPIAAISIVPNSVVNTALNDFCTICFVRKSDSATIETRASGSMVDILSNPNPYLFITAIANIKTIDKKQ